MITADDIIRKVLRLGLSISSQELLRNEIINDVRDLERRIPPTVAIGKSISDLQPGNVSEPDGFEWSFSVSSLSLSEEEENEMREHTRRLYTCIVPDCDKRGWVLAKHDSKYIGVICPPHADEFAGVEPGTFGGWQ